MEYFDQMGKHSYVNVGWMRMRVEQGTEEVTEQQPCIQMRWSGTTYKFIFFQFRRYVRIEIA